MAPRRTVENGAASTSDWIARASGVIYAYDLALILAKPDVDFAATGRDLEQMVSTDRESISSSPSTLRRGPTAVPTGFLAAFELTDLERDAVVRSVVASQSLEGVDIPRATVQRLLDEVLLEPLPDIS